MNNLKKQLRKESHDFVPDIRKTVYTTVGYYKKPRLVFRLKPILSFSLIIIIAFIIFLTPSAKANSYVIIEINPAIGFEIDSNNNIIAVNPLNPDGYLLIENTNFNNLKLNDGILKIAQLARDNGYLDNEDSKITIYPANKNKKIEDKLRNQIKSVLQANINTPIITNNELVNEEAKAYKVSVGKMYLVQKAMEIDPDLLLEETMKLDINTLNNIINAKAKEKINDFNNEYQRNLGSLDQIKNQTMKNLNDEKQNVMLIIKKINTMIDKEMNLDLIKIKIVALTAYFPDFQIDDINNYDDCEEVIDDLEDFIEEQYEFLEDMINEKYELQKEIYHDNVKEKLKDKKDDISFEFDDDFILDKFKTKHNKTEKQIMQIINQINTLIRINKLNNNKIMAKKIELLYDNYETLMESDMVSDAFKNSEIIIEFEINYKNFEDD